MSGFSSSFGIMLFLQAFFESDFALTTLHTFSKNCASAESEFLYR